MASINQNIQSFYAQAAQKDFSRDFLFRVVRMQGVGLPDLNDEDLVYAKTAKLPGRTIENVNASYMGLKFNIPGAATYDSSEAYDIDFYLDATQQNLRTKFEVASREIYNDSFSTGSYQTPGVGNLIVLTQLNKDLSSTGVYYNLVGAQLRKIDAIDYKMAEGKGDIMSVKTTMSYHYYVVGGIGQTLQGPLGTN
jgi:hypothetical protein